jgi:hypothetical protein
MLKITRNLNENEPKQIKTTNLDQRTEENKMEDFFRDNNVNIEFEPLEVYDHGVFWGGVIDQQIQFAFKVTPDENESGVEMNFLDKFNQENKENKEIIEKLDTYYETFYKYWRDSELI